MELDIPPIELHASAVRYSQRREGKILSDVGFSQIVLARELNLQQIKSDLR